MKRYHVERGITGEYLFWVDPLDNPQAITITFTTTEREKTQKEIEYEQWSHRHFHPENLKQHLVRIFGGLYLHKSGDAHWYPGTIKMFFKEIKKTILLTYYAIKTWILKHKP